MAAIVEGDHPPALPGEQVDPAGADPVHLMIRTEAVDEKDRLAFSFVDIGDFDAVMIKTLHRRGFPLLLLPIAPIASRAAPLWSAREKMTEPKSPRGLQIAD